MEKHRKELLSMQFSVIGLDADNFDLISSEWWNKHSWTKTERRSFKIMAYKYLKENRDARAELMSFSGVIEDIFDEWFKSWDATYSFRLIPDVENNDKIEGVLLSLNDLLQEKNRRYGNSALEPLEGINYTAEDGIKIRLVDKLKRIINSSNLRKNDIVDVMGYLTLLCITKKWNGFNELID